MEWRKEGATLNGLWVTIQNHKPTALARGGWWGRAGRGGLLGEGMQCSTQCVCNLSTYPCHGTGHTAVRHMPMPRHGPYSRNRKPHSRTSVQPYKHTAVQPDCMPYSHHDGSRHEVSHHEGSYHEGKGAIIKEAIMKEAIMKGARLAMAIRCFCPPESEVLSTTLRHHAQGSPTWGRTLLRGALSGGGDHLMKGECCALWTMLLAWWTKPLAWGVTVEYPSGKAVMNPWAFANRAACSTCTPHRSRVLHLHATQQPHAPPARHTAAACSTCTPHSSRVLHLHATQQPRAPPAPGPPDAGTQMRVMTLGHR